MNDGRYDSITQPSRRRLLGLIGATAILPLAGCLGDDDNGAPTPTPTPVDTPTPTPNGDPVPPTDDVEGADLDDVPRYPDSVRTDYWGLPDDYLGIEYTTDAILDDIIDFYVDQLPDHGWDITRSEPPWGYAGEWKIEARKDGALLDIYVGPSWRYAGYTGIRIWIEYPAPPE